MIAFVDGESQPKKSLIKVALAEGGEPKEILSLDKEVGTLDWSPDGKHVLFTYTATPSTYADAEEYLKARAGGISSILVEGQNVQTIVSGERNGLAYFFSAWSPDGKRVAYGSFDYEEWVKGGRKEGGFNLWVKDMMTSESKMIMRGGDGYKACWSPDGKSLVFEKRVQGMEFELYKVPAEGGTPEKLNIKGRSPMFSPDGKKIAYTRRLGQGYEFWLVENLLMAESK